MNVHLLQATESPEKLCGHAAAVCSGSKNPEKALQHAMKSGHESVLEHAFYTFEIEGISRVTLAQLTRHRIASFSVQSQRYVKMDEWGAIMPKSIRESKYVDEAWVCIQICMALYDNLIKIGVPAEDARYITPQAITTKIIMTMNARELLHFFSLRTCNRAQWEIRQLADEMLKICRKCSPEIFGKAGPGCITGTCPEAKPCGTPRTVEEWDRR